MRDTILGSRAHLVVRAAEGRLTDPEAVVAAVAAEPGVVAAAPVATADVILKSQIGLSGAMLTGIDPARVTAVTDLAAAIKVGPRGEPTTDQERADILLHLHAPPPALAQDVTDTEALPGIVLGDELAGQIRAYVGDRVYTVNPLDVSLGLATPGVRTWRVAALVHTGMYETDAKCAYVTLADARDYLHFGGDASAVEARLEPGRTEEAPTVARALAARLGPTVKVEDWLSANEGLFKALTLQKWVMAFILAQIISVAALGIVTNLVVLVVTRGREIAILKAMGASRAMIRRIFAIEGVVVGAVGTAAGVALGLVAAWGLARYKFPLDSTVYYTDSLPVLLRPSVVAAAALGALLLCFVATIYPSGRAAGVEPAEGLRYE
jgi:lipoprotein-releasing system permease protein